MNRRIALIMLAGKAREIEVSIRAFTGKASDFADGGCRVHARRIERAHPPSQGYGEAGARCYPFLRSIERQLDPFEKGG